MNAVKGDTSKRAEMIKAMEAAKIDSPRGPLALHEVAQSDPRHLPAQGRGQGEQGRRRRGQEPDRPAARLQALIAFGSKTCARAGTRPARAYFLWTPRRRPMDFYSFADPAPERPPVRAAAVPRRLRPHADLRHHGHHQPRPWQLLHDRRVHGVLAVLAHREPVHCDRARHRAVGRARRAARVGAFLAPVQARPSASRCC